jgi:hypothetical protein
MRIEPREMQERFNKGRYWERAKAGEFAVVVMEDRHPALTAANEPFCTHSQMVSYRDTANREIARVHQYVRPDGSIGASGRPDPKRLYQDGVLYRLVKTPPKQRLESSGDKPKRGAP